ncbi:S1 RNA-binding domain-containing protein [Alkalihalobacillus sp. AL-G]|uniref:CvfB family protein n=1 Tax=Alkalihalobacillus sp. AL-G TaxID=2926399 RepID=UPI00272B36C6|nr:S1-like domain-containing RNA-binding protein [Alkalihalobacillus sp. AL-G]WLD91525.1 S1-like domain-containing RNA-binding protein [Alkalihalobacillus sp. AL-G]
MNSLNPGTTVNLIVERKTELGYILMNSNREEVFLHKSEAPDDIQENQKLNVFLYQDHQGRLAATATMPFIDMNSVAWLEVVGVQRKLGVFVNIGIKKDVLLSKDDLPYDWDNWPKEGDKLYCGLKLDKRGRLFADLATYEEFETLSETAPDTIRNQYLEGYVYRFNEVGAFILTDDRYIAFLHEDEADKKVRLGQRVQVRVTFIREDGRINVSFKAPKEIAYEEDAQKLLDYLSEHDGFMPFHDKSSPEEIKQQFQLSKAAFKRALGKLMKDKKVEQTADGTKLKER